MWMKRKNGEKILICYAGQITLTLVKVSADQPRHFSAGQLTWLGRDFVTGQLPQRKGLHDRRLLGAYPPSGYTWLTGCTASNKRVDHPVIWRSMCYNENTCRRNATTRNYRESLYNGYTEQNSQTSSHYSDITSASAGEDYIGSHRLYRCFKSPKWNCKRADKKTDQRRGNHGRNSPNGCSQDPTRFGLVY